MQRQVSGCLEYGCIDEQQKARASLNKKRISFADRSSYYSYVKVKDTAVSLPS
jgi:hypothetical protein